MRDASVYQWFCMADPGTSGSAFAVIFVAVDIYKPFLFFCDEIYERDVEKTVTPYVGPLIIQKAMALNPNPEQWKCYYDSAGAWFGAHFRKAYQSGDGGIADCGLRFVPVEKRPGEKEDGLDIINTLIINNAIAMSTRCGNTIWEYDNYCRDKNGKLPKRNDHQIDNSRYLVKMAGIVANIALDKPLNVVRRRAKSTRDYINDSVRKSKGKLNLAQRIIKPYQYD